MAKLNAIQSVGKPEPVRVVGQLQLDNAGEFLSHEFTEFLDATTASLNQYNDRWVWAPPRRTQRQPNASIPPIYPSEKMNNNVINTN